MTTSIARRYESTAGSAASRSLATSPAGRRRAPAASPCAVAAAAAARRGSRPFARNAATIAGQDVAGAGGRERRRRRAAQTSVPSPGAATIVSAPLSRQTQPKRSAARARGLEPVRVHPRRLLAEQPAELARVRREHGARPPVARLELVERVRVERRAAARARASSSSRRAPSPPRSRPRPGPIATAPRSARPRATRRRPSVRFTGSSSRASTGQRGLGHGDGDVARVGAERGLGGEADRAGHPRRAADDEHGAGACTCCRSAACAGRARGSPASRAGAPSRRGSSPMSATTTSPRVEDARARPRARPSRPWKVTVSAARTASPATSPGRGVDARGDVDRDDRRAGGVDPLDQRRRLGRAARRGSRCRRARRRSRPPARRRSSRRRRGPPRGGCAPRSGRRRRSTPPPQTTANALRVGKRAQRLARDRRAGPLHQLGDALRVAG